MAKKQSSTIDAADIIPPEADATAQREKGLRMPPIIDVGPGLFGRFIKSLRAWLKGAAYQTVLLALLVMAIGLMVLTLLEAGNVRLPDWRALWPSSAPVNLARDAELPDIKTPAKETPEKAATDIGSAIEGMPPSPQSSLAPKPTAPDLPALPDTMANPIADKGPAIAADSVIADSAIAETALVADLRQTLADTRRQLADANAALLTGKTQRLDGATLAQLSKKAMLADLLLRLDYGLAFDDVLDSGQLDEVLSARELAVLALFAETGVPTEAALRAQAEGLPQVAAAARQSATPLPAALGWLVDAAPDLVQVTPNPMAGASRELAALHAAVMARDYQTGGRLARLILLEQDRAQTPQALTQALQALYADMRAFEETRPVLAALRNDYLAGVRP